MDIRSPVQDLGILFRARSFSHLQEIAATLKPFYSNPVDSSELNKVIFHREKIDNVALSVLNLENLTDCQTTKSTPILTLGDGNCLFNAASLGLCGSIKLATELRLRTALELILNTNFYANHPVISKANIPLTLSNNTKRRNENYSVEGMYFATVFCTEASSLVEKYGFQFALEHEIKTTLRLGNFSGLMQIMGLSSVMGCNINMIYPDKRHSMLPILNCTYSPREATRSRRPTVCIMWTNCGGWPDRSRMFKVNHFVLMATVSNEKEWHVVSRRRRKTRAEDITKSNVPSAKCMKFDTYLPHTKSTGTIFTQPPLTKPTPTSTKPLPAKSFPRTSSPIKLSFTNSNISKPSQTAKHPSRKHSPTRKPLSTNCKTRKPFHSTKNLPAKSRTTNAPLQPKFPSTKPSPKPKHPSGKYNTPKPAFAKPGTTNHLPPKPLSTEPNAKDGLPPKPYTEPNTKDHLLPKPKFAQPSTTNHLPPKPPSTEPETTDHIPPKPPSAKAGTRKPPSTLQRTPTKRPVRQNQTCLTEFFLNTGGRKRTSNSTYMGKKGPPESYSDNITSFSYLSTSRSNEKKLRNIPRITKEVPLAFNVQTFHNDKSISTLSKPHSDNVAEKQQEPIRNLSEDIRNVEKSCSETLNSVLPLSASKSWYMLQGKNAQTNKHRTETRQQVNKDIIRNDDNETITIHSNGVGTESLKDNIKNLEEKVKNEQGLTKQAYFAGILKVAKYLQNKFPILKTQHANNILVDANNPDKIISDGGKIRRTMSSEIYEKLSKYLNIIHIYINGTGFVMENKDTSPILHFVESMATIFDRNNKSKWNKHIENEVGEVYRTALDYMDSERDRNTMKFILTKITSVNFMSRLQMTQNKQALQRCMDLVPQQLRDFESLREKLKLELQGKEISLKEEKQLLRRKLQIEKLRQIRSRRNVITGRKLKVEEFPDLVAILEYEFGEGDNRERGGGGLESHAKLRNDILYRAADNKTKMKDAKEAIMALAPEDFSTCFNYTQNYRKGTYQAHRHHEGKGVNACISLHKAPDTAPIKDLVINIHWTSANVNFILDQASRNNDSYCVDSHDAKQVVRPNVGFGGRTWRNIENPDHTFDTERTNAVTPITHLFVETKETGKDISYNSDSQIQELFMTSMPRKETTIRIKRSGKAVTLLNLSHYEPETAIRSINELLYLMTLPALDNFFRNPQTGKLKEVIVSVVDNGVDMPRSPLVRMLLARLRRFLGLECIIRVSYAEYHSKRNPVERVHAFHTKQLEKHGPFYLKDNLHTDTEEHKNELGKLRDEIQEELSQASFGGTHTLVMNGVGEEENFVFNDAKHLERFLLLNEENKHSCETEYVANEKSRILQDLVAIWDVNPDFSATYAQDYETISNDCTNKRRSAWTDKYTTVIFDEQSVTQNHWEQPLPDYVRWYIAGGEYHYMTFEHRTQLDSGPWDDVKELFLPSRLLDMAYVADPCMSELFIKGMSLLCWCPVDDVERYIKNKEEEADQDYLAAMHRAKWKTHQLYSNSKELLEKMCRDNKLDDRGTKSRLVEKLVNRLSLEKPIELKRYLGNIYEIPSTISEINKLSIFNLKEFLHFHKISWTGCKDQLILRVLALRTSTTQLLFQRERDGLLDVIDIAKKLIHAQIAIHVSEKEFITRKRHFTTPENAELSLERPRQAAGMPQQIINKNFIPEDTTLETLPQIFFELEQSIEATNSALRKKHEMTNIEAIKTCNTRVSVKWKEGDSMDNWKPGWYIATVQSYDPSNDEIAIEYSCEPGKVYHMTVEDNLAEVLKLAQCPSVDLDLYDTYTEIGAQILIKWDKNEVSGTGWKPGWFAAEVQAFYPDDDKIDVIYQTTPEEVYSENPTELIINGKIKLSARKAC